MLKWQEKSQTKVQVIIYFCRNICLYLNNYQNNVDDEDIDSLIVDMDELCIASWKGKILHKTMDVSEIEKFTVRA